MGATTIDELFNGPWGMVGERRDEIESGAFGVFDRVYQEEVDKHFLPIAKAAVMLECHESTARKVLRESKARYIISGLSHFYFKPDIEKTKAVGVHRKAGKKAARDANPESA